MATDIRLKESLPELTARLVKTYSEVSTLNHIGHCPLPNYETIISVIRDLREVLYPGFGRRDGLHMGNITYHAGDLIDRMHDQLTLQIARACCHEAGAIAFGILINRRTSRRSPRRRRWLFSANCPNCGRFWPWTSRPPWPATRRASPSTR